MASPILPLVPVLVDAVNPAAIRVTGNTVSTPYGPVIYAGALYYPLVNPNTDQFVMLKSTDGGLTWIELDPTNGPVGAGGGPTLTSAAYLDVTGQRIVLASLNAFVIQLADFSLATLTWGAPYSGSGSVPSDVNLLSGMYLRPDGTRILPYQTASTGTLSCMVINAANAWVANFNAQTPGGFSGDSPAVLDSTGVLHILYTDSDGHIYYQAVLLNNTLGSLHDFGVLPGEPGYPVIVGAKILWAYAGQGGITPTTGISVFLGTPLSAPVWSQSGNIFVQASADGNFPQVGEMTSLFFDGATIWCLANYGPSDVGGGPDFYLATTQNLGNPLLGWHDVLIYTAPGGAPWFDTVFVGPILTIQNGQQLISFSGNDASANTDIAYFFPIPPNVVPAIKITFRGVKRLVCKPDQDVFELPDAPHVEWS